MSSSCLLLVSPSQHVYNGTAAVSSERCFGGVKTRPPEQLEAAFLKSIEVSIRYPYYVTTALGAGNTLNCDGLRFGLLG
jgi:hypothetical protein